MPLGQSAVSIGIDEVGHEFRMTLEHGLSAFQSQDHERSGIGISSSTIGSKDGGREEAVLHGIARTGVDGMSVFPSALIVEVTVVAAGSHSFVGDSEHGLHLAIYTERIIIRLGDTDMPVVAFAIATADYHLATNLHHIVMDAF